MRPRGCGALALAFGVVAGGLPVPAAGRPDAGGSGRKAFETACAPCHGADARGEPGRLAFGMAMPDFTDCAFATREPDLDWLAVVSEGGPARGFSEAMPPHARVLAEEQIAEVILYLRSLCTDPRWPPGELNLPRPIFTEKAFPEDEAVVTTEVALEDPGSVRTELLFEKRLGPRSQLEVAVPVLALEDAGRAGHWRAGVGDVALGLKHVLHHDGGAGRILSAGAEIVLPTGDEDRGLGTGTAVAEPWLAYGQLLPGRGFLQLQALGELPFDDDRADPEAVFRGALGAQLRQGRFGRAWAPMLEVLVTGVFAEPDTDWRLELVPQVLVTLPRRQHVMASVGVRIPVTDRDTRATQLVVTLLWDWFDGGLLEGW